MKKVSVVFFLLFVVVFNVKAQSKKDSIKVLFGLMQQDSLVSRSFKVMTSSLFASMSSQMPKDTSVSANMSRIMEKSMAASEKVAIRLINEDMVDIYDKYFTQQEINDFIVFYKSKAGQKMISSIPDIQKDIMAVMTAKYAPALQEEIMTEFDELIKTSVDRD